MRLLNSSDASFSVTCDAGAMMDVLADAWDTTPDVKPIVEDKAYAFLRDWAVPFGFTGARLPEA